MRVGVSGGGGGGVKQLSRGQGVLVGSWGTDGVRGGVSGAGSGSLLLLRAGDVESNPGPTPRCPCGVCRGGVGAGAVLCGRCSSPQQMRGTPSYSKLFFSSVILSSNMEFFTPVFATLIFKAFSAIVLNF